MPRYRVDRSVYFVDWERYDSAIEAESPEEAVKMFIELDNYVFSEDLQRVDTGFEMYTCFDENDEVCYRVKVDKFREKVNA